MVGRGRAINFDCMRVFAMCMVILNHIADPFVLNGNQIWLHTGYTYVFESVSHCAIPLFLMLTGVFVIEKAGKTTPKNFYLHSAKKLGIPFIIFVIIYFVYNICIAKTKAVGDIWGGILTGFVGMYAHWYMIMLVMIYAFLPLVAFIKNRVSNRAWTKGVIIFFVWVMCGHYFENTNSAWSLCNMYFMGYVLMGNIIYQKLKSRKNNIVGFGFILCGLAILVFNGAALYYVVMDGGDYYNKLLNLYGAPLIIIASVIIFSGFVMLNVKLNVRSLAEISYIVFLSHKMVINIISTRLWPVLEKTFNYNIRILVPIEFIIVFVLSVLLSLGIYKLLNITVYRRS